MTNIINHNKSICLKQFAKRPVRAKINQLGKCCFYGKIFHEKSVFFGFVSFLEYLHLDKFLILNILKPFGCLVIDLL